MLATAMSVLWALKDTLDGVLVTHSATNGSLLGCFGKDANLYIHDSAAGGYPILVNLDETTILQRMKKYGQSD
jgi:hypothetical protein